MEKFNVDEFLRDFGIRHISEGHKHCQEGWVQITCPFCTGNPGWHLGYSYFGNFFNCWRCGFHPTLQVIQTLAVVHWEEAKKIYAKYCELYVPPSNIPHKTPKATQLSFPTGTSCILPKHRYYLKKRDFCPSEITKLWKIKATGPVGNYKRRILIPIIYNGRLVSFTSRDWTGTQSPKYKACEIEKEVIHHKHILYGLDYVRFNTGILVEGPTDVWKLGKGAVCGFGINLKQIQILLLAERFNRLFIMFDGEEQALKQAEKIGWDLSMMGVDVELELINGDPGALPREDAIDYKKRLIGRYY